MFFKLLKFIYRTTAGNINNSHFVEMLLRKILRASLSRRSKRKLDRCCHVTTEHVQDRRTAMKLPHVLYIRRYPIFHQLPSTYFQEKGKMLLKDPQVGEQKGGGRDTRREGYNAREERGARATTKKRDADERDVDAEDKRREERRVYRRAVPPLARSEFIARVISIHKR